jgi:glucose uptake protein
MILPGNYLFSLLLLVLSLICWGSWANSLKLTGSKWRFELFYFDFAVGVFLIALLSALTFGSLGLDGFTVMDDLKLAGKRQDLMAFLAGCVFNLGNIMLLGAISIGGLTVSIPVGVGVSLVVSSLVGHYLHPEGSVLLLLAGCAAIVAGVAFDGIAWKRFVAMRLAEAREAAASLAAQQTAEGKTAAPASKTAKAKKARKKTARAKVLPLAVIGGIFLGLFYPLVDLAKAGENGIGPYTIALIFSIGVVFSTVVYNLFFMNLPMQGAAVEFRDYFAGLGRQHIIGVLGGVVWGIGALALFVATSADAQAQVGPAMTAAVTGAVPLVGALWGLLGWKEFEGADGNIRLLMGVMLFLLAAGIGVIAVSHSFGVH